MRSPGTHLDTDCQVGSEYHDDHDDHQDDQDDPSLATNLVRDWQERREKEEKSSWELLKSAGETRDIKERHWKIIRLKKLLEEKLKKKLKDGGSSSYSKNEFKPSPKL